MHGIVCFVSHCTVLLKQSIGSPVWTGDQKVMSVWNYLSECMAALLTGSVFSMEYALSQWYSYCSWSWLYDHIP